MTYDSQMQNRCSKISRKIIEKTPVLEKTPLIIEKTPVLEKTPLIIEKTPVPESLFNKP